MELPGTVAASRPPEAARNCRRSIGALADDELACDALWSDEFLGHESWGRDVMRVTSANADGNRQTIVLRHYTTVRLVNKHGKIDFLGESWLGKRKARVEET